MNDYTNKPGQKSVLSYTLLCGIAVIVAAQLRVPMFAEGFVVSAGVILFSLLMLLLSEFAAFPVVLISAVGIMVTRAFAEAGGIVGVEEIWRRGMPEFSFYLVYGMLLYLLFRWWKAEGRYPIMFAALVIPDFVANIVEMYIRLNSNFGLSVVLVLLGVAVVRSVIVLGLYALVVCNGLPALKIPQREETASTLEEDAKALETAAADAVVLYDKLCRARAPKEVLEQAKALAESTAAAVKNA